MIGDKNITTPALVRAALERTSGERASLQALIDEANARLGIGGPRRSPNDDPEHRLQAALIAQVRVWNPHAGPLVRKVIRGRAMQVPAGAWQPGPLGLEYPILLDIYAVPNGGARSKATAGRLKMEGVLPGPPDLNLDAPMRGLPIPLGNDTGSEPGWQKIAAPLFHGLRLETKIPGTKPSAAQAAFMERLVERGYAVAVWRMLDAGVDLLTRYARGEWTQTPELLK